MVRHSRVWRIKHGYGLHAIENEREARALAEFCRKNIEEYYANGWTDSLHLPVWEETLRRYETYKQMEKEGGWMLIDACLNFQGYTDEHIEYYWS